MITIYGLKNCDSCRKALKWLATEGLTHTFLDVRADGIDDGEIGRWTGIVGWETLLNRRSTTWKGLAEIDRDGIDENKAVALMAANPTLIKRPVMVRGNTCTVGFGAAQQAAMQS
jgi:arsenate reductase